MKILICNRKTLIIQISYALQYAKCNKVICINGIYECCRDCLLIIKIDICNKVDVARYKCPTIYECWRDWRDYMNEDSGVMIVCISELFPNK